MKPLYTTSAKATSGRQGNAQSDDGLLNVELAYPKELGGNGGATNPEQMFAAGYAACFSNAVLHIARETKVAIKQAPVSANVSLYQNEQGGFVLGVALAAEVDLPQEDAEKLILTAHQVCPYSNAVKGNIDVRLTVNGQEIAA
jgi:Ohr subfamily peroxiredoxin